MTQPKTFMLLPDHTYKLGGSVQLGTILFLSEDTKIPDPDVPVNEDSRVIPDPGKVKTVVEEPWLFVYDVSRSGSGGINAEIPIFAPVSAKFILGRSKSMSMKLQCERLDTQRFAPTSQYLAQALANEDIKQYCKQHFFPSVYLVTGLKVATKATIHQTSKLGNHRNVDLSLDATGFGAPIKVGPTVEGAKDVGDGKDSTIAGPFILAYELKRIRLRRAGTLKETRIYNKHALFDDRVPIEPESEQLDEMWVVDDVGPETEHDA